MNLPSTSPLSSSTSQMASGEAARLQYCRVLADRDAKPGDCRRGWKSLQEQMALVPGGRILVSSAAHQPGEHPDEANRHYQLVQVDGFYMDRMAVSNQEFSRFVRSGGYTEMSFWPNQIWSCIVQMVDQSGTPGPKMWRNGKPAREKLDHPVTGISWYEARAYANWAGKTLPGTEQWQRACTWGVSAEGRQDSIRYPWGNLYEDRRANLWNSGFRDTLPVDQFVAGATPNGIYQLIGNVWEWIDNPFVYPGTHDIQVADMAEIRGGAFDTYLPSQATSQFRSGQPRLLRAPNIGFRCCIPASEIHYSPVQ